MQQAATVKEEAGHKRKRLGKNERQGHWRATRRKISNGMDIRASELADTVD